MKKEKQVKGQLKKLPPKDNFSTEKGSRGKFIFNLVGLIIIIVLGIIVYSNCFKCSFHFDDYGSIIENDKIRNLSDFKSIWNFSQNRFISYYSFALNYHYGQLDVWGYHLVNLIIHLFSACLVWWLTVLILISPVLKEHPLVRYKNEIAITTALLFVTHPLATQSVNYIVQRMASLTAMFYLLSIALYLKYRLTEMGFVLKTMFVIGSILAALLALLTKENAYTLPFAIALVEFFFIRAKKLSLDYFKDYRVILPLITLICIVVFVILKFSFNVFKPIPPSEGHNYTLTVYNYFLTQLSVIVKYIQLLLLPINQMVDYDFPLSNHFFEIRTLLSFILLASLIVLALFLFSKHRVISFGILWFFLTLSVESSIIPIADVIFEHRTYLPSFGYFLLLSYVFFILFREKYKLLLFAIFAFILGMNSYLSYQRNKVWKDELSLWSDNIKKAPDLPRPLTNRANAYTNLKMWDKAISDYNRAIAIDPKFPKAYYNRGFAYRNIGQWDKALTDYIRAVEIKPDYILALSDCGVVHAHFEQWDKAIENYNRVIAINPSFISAYYNRGVALSSLNQWDKAITDYTQTITLDPNYIKAYYNRGIAFAKLQQWDKAIMDYTKVIQLDPKYKQAFVNRAVVYGNLMQWEKAIEDYNSALRIDPNYSLALGNLEFAKKNIENRKNQ